MSDKGKVPVGSLHLDDPNTCRWLQPSETFKQLMVACGNAATEEDGMCKGHSEHRKAKIAQRAEAKRIDREATELVTREDQADKEIPPLVNLVDMLLIPDEPVQYLVEDLWPADGRVLLAAPNKSGKTTLVGNVIRSLADGDAFLGKYACNPVMRVVVLDDEMSEGQLRRWLRDQGIKHPERIEVISMRGSLSTFNILDPAIRAEWATRIGKSDVLIFDCLRPALDSLGLEEATQSGRFLTALDELVKEASIDHLLVVHHMGHGAEVGIERARGDSRLEDWPDVKWRILKSKKEDDDSKFFWAFGRDVDQPEQRLAFDPEKRHLSIDGGSRSQESNSGIELDVLTFIADSPDCSGAMIEKNTTGNGDEIRKAIRRLESRGQIEIEDLGRGKAKKHRIATESPFEAVGESDSTDFI